MLPPLLLCILFSPSVSAEYLSNPIPNPVDATSACVSRAVNPDVQAAPENRCKQIQTNHL